MSCCDVAAFRYQDTCCLPSRATLVIAPSHLTEQWHDEIVRHTHGFKTIVIVGKLGWDKVTYLDLMLADVVIVSVQFLLTNPTYKKTPKGDDAVTAFVELLRKPGACVAAFVNLV